MSDIMPPGPLSYTGQVVVPYILKDFAPTTAFFNFPVPTVWVWPAQKRLWLLVSIALGVATWIELGSGGTGPLLEFDGGAGTTGFPVFPTTTGVVTLTSTGGTITITGTTNSINFDLSGGGHAIDSFTVPLGTSPINADSAGNVALTSTTGQVQVTGSTGGSPHNIDFNALRVAKWIVDPTTGFGTHTTLQSTNASVAFGDTVFIRPGAYSVAAWVPVPGVNYVAFESDAAASHVIFQGAIACTFTGTVYFGGIYFQATASSSLAFTGTNVAGVQLIDCFFGVDTGLNFISSSNPNIAALAYDCQGSGLGALFSLTAASSLGFTDCNLGFAGTSAASAGNITMVNSNHSGAISLTSAGHLIAYKPNFVTANLTAITLAGTATAYLYDAVIATGTASSVSIGAGTTLTALGGSIASSNANAVDGASTGIFKYSKVTWDGSSSTINAALTQTPLPIGPRILLTGGTQILSGTGDPNATVTAPKGSLYTRTNGSGVNDRAYINTDAGTTWTALVTVA